MAPNFYVATLQRRDRGTESIKVSWQDYIDTQLVGRELKEAVIAGHDGNVWAKSSNFNVTPGEIQAILKNYSSQGSLASSGFSLGGTKYFYLSGDDEVIRGKQGKGGVHCVKTNQPLLVGVYDAPMEPATAATITEKLGDYLKGVGYLLSCYPGRECLVL